METGVIERWRKMHFPLDSCTEAKKATVKQVMCRYLLLNPNMDNSRIRSPVEIKSHSYLVLICPPNSKGFYLVLLFELTGRYLKLTSRERWINAFGETLMPGRIMNIFSGKSGGCPRHLPLHGSISRPVNSPLHLWSYFCSCFKSTEQTTS